MTKESIIGLFTYILAIILVVYLDRVVAKFYVTVRTRNYFDNYLQFKIKLENDSETVLTNSYLLLASFLNFLMILLVLVSLVMVII